MNVQEYSAGKGENRHQKIAISFLSLLPDSWIANPTLDPDRSQIFMLQKCGLCPNIWRMWRICDSPAYENVMFQLKSQWLSHGYILKALRCISVSYTIIRKFYKRHCIFASGSFYKIIYPHRLSIIHGGFLKTPSNLSQFDFTSLAYITLILFYQ